MEMTKDTILQMLEDAGGATTEYPFIETGQTDILDELVHEGLLSRIARENDLDEIRITDKGRAVLCENQER